VLCRALCALLFLAWTAEAPKDTVLYCGLWRSPFELFAPLFVSLPGINLFAWQVLLLALAPLCLLRPGAFRNRAWPMDAAILTSLASVALTFLWGWVRGGSPYSAYYQLWRFLLALLIGLMLLSVVRNSRDLRAVGLTVLAAALVRGTLAIYFYWTHARGRAEPPSYMTTHDDSLLFVAGLLVILSWALARTRRIAWLVATMVSAHLLYAILLNNRRLAWIELLLTLGLVYRLLPAERVARRVNRLLLLASPVLLLYVIVGWGRPGAVFEPLRALATSGSDEDLSSLARQEEIRNLLYTLSAVGNPLLGTGWGVPYQKVTSVYANFGEDFWGVYLYTPHNSLLGVAVFGGLVGVFGIWLVVPVAAFLATRGYRGAAPAVDRAAAMAAVCVLPAYGVQCYGDLGFQSFTGSLILGVAIAAAGKVSAWAGPPPESARRDRSRATTYGPSPAVTAEVEAESPPRH
jgi:O-Antigen ligase